MSFELKDVLKRFITSFVTYPNLETHLSTGFYSPIDSLEVSYMIDYSTGNIFFKIEDFYMDIYKYPDFTRYIERVKGNMNIGTKN